MGGIGGSVAGQLTAGLGEIAWRKAYGSQISVGVCFVG